MSRNRLRTDLGLIRDALTYAQDHSNYATAAHFGIQATTLRRWQLRQMREPNGWPTQDDVDAYRADAAEKAADRARRAAQVAGYRNRIYLNRGPLWVDSIGTVRRLRALYALGWTQDTLGERMGISPQYVSILTRGRHPKVHRDTFNAVAYLYDQLSMTVPTVKPQWVHERHRRHAAARGWVTPLAWPEGQIDNPAARPQGMDWKATG